MINITAIHLAGGQSHEHIAAVRWINPANNQTGESTRETMVDWIRDQGGKAFVRDATGSAAVGVVDGHPPYLRTHADGRWTDNLLALPHY